MSFDELTLKKAILQVKGYPLKIRTIGGKFCCAVRNDYEVFDTLPKAIERSIGKMERVDDLFR